MHIFKSLLFHVTHRKCSKSNVTSGGCISETSWMYFGPTIPPRPMACLQHLTSIPSLTILPPLINSSRLGLPYRRRASSVSHQSLKQDYWSWGKEVEEKVLAYHPHVETTGFLLCFWVPKHSSKHITGIKYHLLWLFTNQELKVMEGRKGDIWTQGRIPAFSQSWAPQNKRRAWGLMFQNISG